MIRFIGADPDTTNTGLAFISEDGAIEFAVAKARGRFAEDRFPAMARALRAEFQRDVHDLLSPECELGIEFQKLRPGREKNPNAMMGINAVAGMILAAADQRIHLAHIHLPIPSDWKGTVPKEIMHKRILAEAGLTLNSREFQGIPGTGRSHVIDALGIALWLKRGRVLR